jgi:hypothetical protein
LKPWKISLAVALLGPLCSSNSGAWAQPTDGPAGNMKPVPSIQVVSVSAVRDELALTARFENASATEALGRIARLGNLQIIVPGRLVGKIDALQFEAVSPEQALKKVCDAAHFSYQRVEGVWNIDVRPPDADPKAKPAPMMLELSFSDVPVRDLVGILAEHFVLSVDIAPEVKGTIAQIRLDEISPEKALQKIAQAANLDLAKVGQKFLLTAKKASPA